jgi:hypothetical protein
MANHLAIAATARTVLKLLEDHCPREEFTGTPAFVLYASHDFGTPQVSEGFSVLVWRIGASATRRLPPPREPDGRRRLPGLPVDLSLLLTAWATEPERQLRLTGWALRFLEDHAVIPAALLNQSLTQRSVPAFRPEESVELLLDALTIPDHLGLWDKFRNRWMTSLNYSARMIQLESERLADDGPPVLRRDFEVGQIDTRRPGGPA